MTDYESLIKEAQSLISGVNHLYSNLANLSALINGALSDVNWVGFYLLNGDKLVLGPFQGKPACIEIPVGRGVCGTSVEKDETMVVRNVHEFKGHIACDSESNSEIVIPIHHNNIVVMVLDIDSKEFARFTEFDKTNLERLVKMIEIELNDLL